MSLFDKKLIEELVKIGNEFEEKFVRRAQMPTPKSVVGPLASINPAAVDASNRTLAQKLVMNLQAQLHDGTEMGENGDPEIFMRDVQNVSNFINYAMTNNLKKDGLPLVIRAATNERESAEGLGVDFTKGLTPEQKTKYATYPKGKEFFYYVNKDGVTDFLKALQTKAATEKNAFKIDVVGKLINDFNHELSLKISTDPNSSTPTSTDEELDKIPDVVNFNVTTEPGPHPLMVSDLKDRATIANFIKKFKIKYKEPNPSAEADKFMQPTDFLDNKNGVCKFISYLVKRVENINMDEAKLQKYKTLVNTVNAKFCDVGAHTNFEIADNNPQSANGNDAPGAAIFNYVTTKIKQGMPVNDEELDLNNIKSFCLYVKEFYTKPEFQGAIARQYNINPSDPAQATRLNEIISGMNASVQGCEKIVDNMINEYCQPTALQYDQIVMQTQGGSSVDQSYQNFKSWLKPGKNNGAGVSTVIEHISYLLTNCGGIYNTVTAFKKSLGQEEAAIIRKWNARLGDIKQSADAAKSHGH